jgi:DNA-binding response OmpR family regulator
LKQVFDGTLLISTIEKGGDLSRMAAKRILLVEDETGISDFLTIALRGEGYEIDVAATAAEAWAYLDAHSYALVITDWRLPDGDGMVIADAALQLGAKTLLMSGYLFHMPGGRAEAHETLMKPVRPSEMVAVVHSSIGTAALS